MSLNSVSETSTVWLETAINKYLSLDPEVTEKLAELEGRVIAVEITGVDKSLYFFPHQAGMDVLEQYEGEVNTTLKGSPVALLKMSLSKDVAPLMLKGEVEIAGDVRLGRSFKKILSEMEVDWEEYMARIIGDAPAHHLAGLTKKIISWGQQASNDLALDVSEYLQEESRDLVSKPELEKFYQDVDELRNQLDRVQARFNALKSK
ncbi:MAG: SCP2 sterol-binding domain-containing protein [Gammaproteobacteria bacterium]|nr:SCP2 sterol-binding domain-containing protein [Gammaproteobacteria bacterium]MCW8922981.1 SCP2 sterol-binding domain-containing protein [Gammaproteobacteria bacterium]